MGRCAAAEPSRASLRPRRHPGVSSVDERGACTSTCERCVGQTCYCGQPVSSAEPEDFSVGVQTTRSASRQPKTRRCGRSSGDGRLPLTPHDVDLSACAGTHLRTMTRAGDFWGCTPARRPLYPRSEPRADAVGGEIRGERAKDGPHYGSCRPSWKPTVSGSHGEVVTDAMLAPPCPA